VKHRDDNANDRRNQRTNSDVESPTRVIEALFFSRYLLNFFFIPFNVVRRSMKHTVSDGSSHTV
jgi:hypothetical protein